MKMHKLNGSAFGNNNWWKRAGIVDAPSRELSDVFEPGSTRMRDDVVDKINNGLSRIQSYMDANHPGVRIVGHEVIGAAVTYQFTSSSDIDTTVFINIPKNDPRFKVINDWIGDHVDGSMFHGERPFQFKIQPSSGMGKITPNADAIYDPASRTFVKKPDVGSASTSFRSLIESGRSQERLQYRRMEEEFRGMVRSWAKVGRKAIGSGSPENFSKWLLPQAAEIMSALERAKKIRTEGYSESAPEGRISRNWSSGNIIFKFLERDGYIDLFKMIKASLADGAIHPDELKASVEMAEAIMNQDIGYNPRGGR